MGTDLTRIGKKAKKEPELVFTSLYHHITNVDNLRESFRRLDGKKVVGIDGVRKEVYAKDLERNLEDIAARLKRMGYRPQAKRRAYIPKPGNTKGRPLGISTIEDKIVELSVKRVLVEIYEGDFEDSSYGYRPGRSQIQCVKELGCVIQQKSINHVVEADIRGFFDSVNHEWMLKFLGHRIGDTRVLRLIRRMLKAGIMENGLVHSSNEGTSQGSILSPLLSNIYLHYVLDIWFERRIRPRSKGAAYLFRYADDFVGCFQCKTDAEDFLDVLSDRLEGFNLEVAEEKTRSVEFGRYARTNAYKRGMKPKEFDFLGFTFYCGKTRNGYFKVKRRTSRKKFQQSVKNFKDWIKRHRNVVQTGELLKRSKTRLVGHLNYYAVTDNTEKCKEYHYIITKLVYKWLNRRSQRKSCTWERYQETLGRIGWPGVLIKGDINPFCQY
jgi:group II intron reverse transcriptase/maturase